MERNENSQFCTPKDYNIVLPIPFKKLKNVWNNIGVIFIKWPKNGISMNSLETQINENKYHAIATNLFLRGSTSSSLGIDTRKNVDLVFTSGYVQMHLPYLSIILQHLMELPIMEFIVKQ